MIYDGEMTKFVGTSGEPITWKGHLGVIAGSTPTIYHHFEEVADMGERFIYYRMKDYNPEKATRLAMGRKICGKDLDDTLSHLYAEYIKEVVKTSKKGLIELPEIVQERIIAIAQFAERIRTPVHMDFKQIAITRIPISAMPMRVALQLTSIAKGLHIIRKYEEQELSEKDMQIIDHCGWSLANEEKRAVLKILANIQYGEYLGTGKVADKIGLDTNVVRSILQNLASVKVIERSRSEQLEWRIIRQSDWNIVRRIEKIDDIMEIENGNLTSEEDEEESKRHSLDSFGREILPDDIKI